MCSSLGMGWGGGGALQGGKLVMILTSHALMIKLFTANGRLTVSSDEGLESVELNKIVQPQCENYWQPPTDKSVSVLQRRLCEEGLCPLSFGFAEDGQ